MTDELSEFKPVYGASDSEHGPVTVFAYKDYCAPGYGEMAVKSSKGRSGLATVFGWPFLVKYADDINPPSKG